MTESTIEVLAVDDDPSVTALTESMLERADDVEVTTTTSPTETLELFAPERFDCVVSDYDMPGMDGLELYERLAGAFPHPEFPFVLFTGRGSEEVAAEALNARVTGYL